MSRLYGYKWTSNEGEVTEDLPNTYGFKLWLDKTSHLTPEQWKKGLDRCEQNVRHSSKTGDDCWPPSYAEFIGYCDEQRTGAYKIFKMALPESKESREERKRLGREKCANLKSILDE